MSNTLLFARNAVSFQFYQPVIVSVMPVKMDIHVYGFAFVFNYDKLSSLSSQKIEFDGINLVDLHNLESKQ